MKTGLLDCNAYRTFWIKWDSTLISVGTGDDIESGSFMDYEFADDNKYMINYASVTTGWGAVGHWNMIDCGKYS